MSEWLFNRIKPLIIGLLVDLLEEVVKQYKEPNFSQVPDAPGLKDDLQRLLQVLAQAVDVAAQHQVQKAIQAKRTEAQLFQSSPFMEK